MLYDNDVISRLPASREVAREIYNTTRHARRLRKLYQLIQRIESEETTEAPAATAPKSNQGGDHE